MPATEPTQPTPVAAVSAPVPTGHAPTPQAQTLPPPQVAETIMVPVSTFQALTAAQTRLLEIQAEATAKEREQARKDAETLAEQGRLKEGLSALQIQREKEVADERTKREQTELRARNYALQSELSTALAEQPIVSGSLPQLLALMRGELQVVPEGDGYKVQTPTFQDVRAFVKERLAREDHAHFLKPTSTGGTAGSTGAHHSAPTPAGTPPPQLVPQTLGEAAMLDTLSRVREMKEQYKGIPATLNPRQGFGGFKGVG